MKEITSIKEYPKLVRHLGSLLWEPLHHQLMKLHNSQSKAFRICLAVPLGILQGVWPRALAVMHPGALALLESLFTNPHHTGFHMWQETQEICPNLSSGVLFVDDLFFKLVLLLVSCSYLSAFPLASNSSCY